MRHLPDPVKSGASQAGAPPMREHNEAPVGARLEHPDSPACCNDNTLLPAWSAMLQWSIGGVGAQPLPHMHPQEALWD